VGDTVVSPVPDNRSFLGCCRRKHWTAEATEWSCASRSNCRPKKKSSIQFKL